jgi:hypothetical protein
MQGHYMGTEEERKCMKFACAFKTFFYLVMC